MKPGGERRTQRRAQFIAGRLCEDCGSTEKLVFVLKEYGPDTKPHNSNMWRLPEPELQAVLALRTVVCRPCEKKRMQVRGTRPTLQHGTPGMYRNGCRCQRCKKWKKEYTRVWREKNPEKVATYRAKGKAKIASLV